MYINNTASQATAYPEIGNTSRRTMRESRCPYETDVLRIQAQLPSFSECDIRNLIVDRRGSLVDSHMITHGLHVGVEAGKTYQITSSGFKEVNHLNGARFLEHEEQTPPVLPSQSAKIEGIWDKTIANLDNSDNVFGGFGRFISEAASLDIPVVEANEEDLSYYGATIINMGDVVKFEVKEYPIWTMSLGENYVQGYIMETNGFYVEYHDKPHFHMPLSPDAKGCYILGKQVETNTYRFTGFRIPLGKAVYTNKGSIHCDASLIGKEWLVGYTSDASEVSTVLLRTEAQDKVCFTFH